MEHLLETQTGDAIIELTELTKRYGEQTAVSRLNLSIVRGEVFGLLGPNGAGKTTTILMMLGLAEPTSGHVKVCGLDPKRNPLEVKRRVGYMPDDIGFYEDRTGIDNLMFTARLNGIPVEQAKAKAEALLERVGLAEAKRKKVGAYSRGMRQRLGIADVLIKDPEIIILDEPTLGIDPEGVRELLHLIHELSRNEGITVLLSSHHLHQVQQICDRVGLFVKGRLIASGDVESLASQLDDERVIRVELEASGWTEQLTNKLQELEGVISVDGPHDTGTAGVSSSVLTCSIDLTAAVAQAAIEHGSTLHAVKRKQYGLDDIYHRFFEGGGTHGQQDGIH